MSQRTIFLVDYYAQEAFFELCAVRPINTRMRLFHSPFLSNHPDCLFHTPFLSTHPCVPLIAFSPPLQS